MQVVERNKIFTEYKIKFSSGLKDAMHHLNMFFGLMKNKDFVFIYVNTETFIL